MRARRVLILAGAGGLLLVLSGAPAAAAGPGFGWADPADERDSVDFGAQDGAAEPPTSSTGGETQCSWRPATRDDAPGVPTFEHGGNQEFDWYIKECVDRGGRLTRELISVPRDAPPVDPVTLRERVVDRLELPRPAVSMNPPDEQVVHVETWLWVDDAMWQAHGDAATAGGVTVTVTATPQRVVWDMGNGDVVVCEGPGTPYDQSRPADEQSTDCSYTYRHSSAGQPGEAYEVTATVEWTATWTVAGADGGGALPALRTTTPVAVRVAEIQALNS